MWDTNTNGFFEIIISSQEILPIIPLCTNWAGKNVWTRAYLIPERNRTGRRQEEGQNSVYLFVFCMNLGEINALLTIYCCQMKHFGYVIVYINWEISDNVLQNDDQLDPNPEFRSVSLWIARIEWNEMYRRNDKNRHFVLLIIDISKHGVKEMGHVKMEGPGFVNDVIAWWPGFVPKKFTNKQEPKQQKSTATIVYTVIHFHNSMT